MKFTRDTEQWFLAEIDAWKVKQANQGRRCGESAALRASMRTHYLNRYLKKVHPLPEAKQLTVAFMKAPLFATYSSGENRISLVAKCSAPSAALI